MLRPTLLTALALTPVLAGSAAAQTPTVATDKACYVEQEPMTISGTGFTAGANVDVSAEQLNAFGTADPMGNFSFASETAPILATVTPDTEEYSLVAKQDGVQVATTTFRVANFAVRLSPTTGNPRSRGNWSFSGFAPNKSIWVHVRRSGKTVGNFRFGKAASPCGTLRRRAKRLPIANRRIRGGKYQLYFDAAKSFRTTTRPQIRYETTVFG